MTDLRFAPYPGECPSFPAGAGTRKQRRENRDAKTETRKQGRENRDAKAGTRKQGRGKEIKAAATN